jgi:hypothetical protein
MRLADDSLSPVKCLSKATATAVILSFVLASIAFACPDPARMRALLFSDAPASEMGEQAPCSGAKEEMCASVRDSLLSIRAAVIRLVNPLQNSTVFAPLKAEAFAAREFFSGSLCASLPFHPVFKLRLPFAYSVLRI